MEQIKKPMGIEIRILRSYHFIKKMRSNLCYNFQTWNKPMGILRSECLKIIAKPTIEGLFNGSGDSWCISISIKSVLSFNRDIVIYHQQFGSNILNT